jgi:hypothetical protein
VQIIEHRCLFLAAAILAFVRVLAGHDHDVRVVWQPFI